MNYQEAWNELKGDLERRIKTMEGTETSGIALYVMAIKDVQDMMEDIEISHEWKQITGRNEK